MSWSEFHERSERIAIDATAALKARRTTDAEKLFREAAELESLALADLDISKQRTRGVTAVSAVALWFKGAAFERAEQIAHLSLADATMPDFARRELRTLVQAIWTETTKRDAGIEFIPGQVMVSVKGGEVITGAAPLDLVVDKVQTIQAMFYRTIEFLNGVAHRRIGRPTKELQEACRPWLFQSVPGSYQFSVGIQKPAQADFFDEDLQPERIAHHFLEIVQASVSHDSTELTALVPDAEYRSTFLKLARNLAPTGKSFDQLELRTSGDSKPVSLSVEARQSITQQLKPPSKSSDLPQTETIDLKGVLRALHLDKDWLELLVDGVGIQVTGLQDTVDDVIGPMVNRAVIVKATIASKGKFRFVDIELSD